ncbi:MAG: Gfo/Idh/MocA family oxidoreductase [Clostridia bacterium]|nr:Gfo/Idh/MocA family oxidoreductase [Clostridia bacterium]
MKTIGIGIIGWGFMGRMHAYGILNMPLYYNNSGFKAKLIGVCSGHIENALHAKEELDLEFATDDYRELLKRDDIDAVCICTPNDTHEEIFTAAARAKKHIYIEKPLALDYAQAQRMAKTARECGVIVNTVFNNRFYPATMRAKQLIDEGRLGDIISFRAAYLHSGSVDPNRPAGWKQLKSASAGTLPDLGSHVLDLVHWLIGDVAKIFCKTQTPYKERTNKAGQTEDAAEDAAYMTLVMENGAMGMVEATKIATGQNDSMRFEISGTKGAVRFDSADPNWLWFYDNTEKEGALGLDKGYKQIESIGRFEKPGGAFPSGKNGIGFTRCHAHSMFNFVNSINEGKQTAPTIDDGAYVNLLLDKARLSDESGVFVNVR